MRIAFVGLPLAALLLLEDGHEIVWAGICRRGALGTRRLRARLGARRLAVVPDLAARIDEVKALAPDLVVSWFWTKKVPRGFRETARFGAFGVHPSLLPRHRGPDPYFWAIARGDAETGVTAHELEDEYDTGALLGTKRLPIDPAWNAWTLAKKLDRPSLALLREVTAAFARGERPVAVPQDEAAATEAPAPSDDDLELRWNEPAAAVVRRVRAASPWPGAFTEIASRVVTLTRARVTDDVPRAIEPGEAFVRPDGVLVVRARDRGVELLSGRVTPDAEREDDDEIELGTADLAALVPGGAT